ncbi:MAG: hypothetical protein KAI47_23465 [Deltaproteobacteria bacterium]|nr:hypothetical protein [Deltaproteobacteria bacterium]
MKDLSTLIAKSVKRKTIIDECCTLIDAEVKTKGLIVKGVYKLVKAIKPGTIPSAVDGLLDDFVAELQKFYARFQEEGGAGTLATYLGDRATDVAEALLTVTDERARRSAHKTMVKGYRKLRPKGKEHVTLAVPKVGALLDRHLTEIA